MYAAPQGATYNPGSRRFPLLEVPLMNPKPQTTNLSNLASNELETPNAQVMALEKRAGALGRWQASWELRNQAKDALVQIHQDNIDALRDVQQTAIALAKASIKSGMVAEAMPALGTLTNQLNMATGSVDQALTTSANVETVTHLNNRKQNLDLIESLKQQGKITAEEAQLLANQIHADCFNDMARTSDRKDKAKDTVAAVHSFGVTHIERAKDQL
jgi:hypothetical protein